jgi:hypothetical protein
MTPGRVFVTLAVAVSGAWAIIGQARSTAADAPAVLDHIPIAVANLERAAERYRSLGFVLKPGRSHDNGIRNEHAKFPDGSELELITAQEARDDLTSRYRRHLADGDGPAFLALHAPSLSDGARKAAPAYVFFGGLNHSPTDKPEHFVHPNGADALIGVWLAGADLSRERALLRAMKVKIERRTVHAPDAFETEVGVLGEGSVVFLPQARQLVKGRPIAGATVRVKSLTAARAAIGTLGSPLRTAAGPGWSSVFVPPALAHGLWLEFREIR